MALQVPAGAKVHDLPKVAPGNFRLDAAPLSPLFAGPPRLEDISQGSIADCFFLASLMAILSRQNGTQAIQDMMVEHNGAVTVRLHTDAGQAIYLRTPKCRVYSVPAGGNVSARQCCWVDVLEACASVFNMKSRDGAPDIPMDLANPSLENLNLGLPTKALTVLLGITASCTSITDTRTLDINVNPGYGQIQVLLDANIAPDRAYRQEIIDGVFGKNLGSQWNAWAARNATCFDQFLARTDKSPAPTNAPRRARTIKTTMVKAFIEKEIPKEYQEGLARYLTEQRAVAGTRTEPVYLYSESEHYDKLDALCRKGWPVVLLSRAYVGTSQGKGAGGEDMHLGMLGGHCYCLERVFTDEHKRQWLLITNPWGRYVRDYDIVTGKPFNVDNFAAQPVGQFRITLHDLVKKFESYSWSEVTF